MGHDLLRDLLGSLELPEAPSGLKERAVSSAAGAMTRRAAGDDVWTRLWHSRPLRLAWAASVAALLAGHLVVSLHLSGGHTTAGTPSGGAAADRDSDLRAIAALPPIDLGTVPALDGAPVGTPPAGNGRGGPERDGKGNRT